jgi:sugar lactone lactonase YvrE
MTIVSLFLHLTLAPVVFVLLASCSDNGTDPPPPEPSGRQHPIAWPSLANSPWPMGNHDPQATGRSAYVAASSGVVTKHIEGLRVTGGPVLGEDGTIYYQAADSTLRCALIALDSDGRPKWKVGIDSLHKASSVQKLYSRLIVASDGTIYTNSLDEAIYAVNPNGTIKWLLSVPERFLDNSMTIGMDGTIYAGTEGGVLYAITPEGSVKWSRGGGFSGYSHGVLSPDGNTLYVGGWPNGMYALTLDGSTKWFYPNLESEEYDFRMVDNSGNIYAATRDSLVSVRPDGTRRWAVTAGDYVVGGTIDWEGNIYFAVQKTDRHYHLCAVDQSGELLWTHALGRWFPEHMVCDAASAVYAGSGSDGEYFCVRSNGALKWNLVFSPHIEVSTSPAITSGGVLLLPSGSTTETEVFGLFFVE